MKAKWLFLLILAAFVAGSAQSAAAEEKKAEAQPAAEEKAKPEAKAEDDDWLNTVWTQVDDMVKEEEFKLQETVTVAGLGDLGESGPTAQAIGQVLGHG